MIRKEIWLPIQGYKGLYEISNFGRVRGLPNRYTGWKQLILKLQLIRRYHYIGLHKNGKQITKRVNRLVALHFIPNPLNLPDVHHKDYNKLNNRSTNLKWVTKLENTKDAFNKGVVPIKRGSDSPCSKFTDVQIKKIFNSKKTCLELSKIYNVAFQTISAIKTGKKWSHITGKKYKQKYNRLTKEIVLEIFNYTNLSHEEIGNKYGISQSMVSMIKRGYRWNNVTHKK